MATILIALAVPLVLLVLLWPGVVALLGVAALYLNVSGVAATIYGVPSLVAAGTFILLLAPFVVRILIRREPVIVDRPLLFMGAFMGAVLLSLFVVEDFGIALRWVATFVVEGLLVYFLALNLFRTQESVRRVVDVLMLSGALLAGLTVYQEATKSYDEQFWGFAQRNVEYGTGADHQLQDRDLWRDPDKIHLAERSGGPLGAPNRYAQTLLFLLPLVYFRMRGQKRISLKALALVCLGLILGGTLLTYSRGGFVGLAVVILIMLIMRALRLRHVAVFAALLAAAVVAWAPGYVLRVATLTGLPGMTDPGATSAESDMVFRGRLTEMLAAYNVFLDHPIVGVGPGQFAPVYSLTYMSDPDIAFRNLAADRRAHTLYFELAAETGLLGFVSFMAVVGLIQVRLWRAWKRWRGRREDLAGMAGGFFLAICSYLVTAVFLQLAYQRYYWLLLGLAGAALQIIAQEERKARLQEGRPSRGSPLVLYGRAERGPVASTGASG